MTVLRRGCHLLKSSCVSKSVVPKSVVHSKALGDPGLQRRFRRLSKVEVQEKLRSYCWAERRRQAGSGDSVGYTKRLLCGTVMLEGGTCVLLTSLASSTDSYLLLLLPKGAGKDGSTLGLRRCCCYLLPSCLLLRFRQKRYSSFSLLSSLL